MPHPGETFHSLAILKHCGGGGFGEVYLCRDITGQRLALKLIPKGRVGDGWERELKGITHYRSIAEGIPGLLRIFHVGADDDFLYYTMEPADPVDGGDYVPDTLAARLSRGPLPPETLHEVLQSLLENIVALHRMGFAHRDIKPDNILFVHGRPKLGDLGLLSPLTGTMTQLAGTLDFLPPEVRSGDTPMDTQASRQRNDLYAFGKLVYCCVTGNGAGSFPSWPSALPLTLVNKLYFRLARRLCDRVPQRRLVRLEKLERAFARIRHQCLYGETFADHLRHGLSAVVEEVVSWPRRLGASIRRRWRRYCCLALAGVALYVVARRWRRSHRPPLPDPELVAQARELAERKRQMEEEIRSQRRVSLLSGRYTVTVPKDWEVMTRADIEKSPRKLIAGFKEYGQLVLTPPGPSEEAQRRRIYAIACPMPRRVVKGMTAERRRQLVAEFAGKGTEFTLLDYQERVDPRLGVDVIQWSILWRGTSLMTLGRFYLEEDVMLAFWSAVPQKNEGEIADQVQFFAVADSLRRHDLLADPDYSRPEIQLECAAIGTPAQLRALLAAQPPQEAWLRRAVMAQNFANADALLAAGLKIPADLWFQVADAESLAAADYLLAHHVPWAELRHPEKGRNPLAQAIALDETELAAKMIQAATLGELQKSGQGGRHWDPLHWAIMYGRLECMDALLAKGMRPGPSQAGETPHLVLAAIQENPEVLRRLLALPGIDLEVRIPSSGSTALLMAVILRAQHPEQQFRLEIVRMLVEAGANVRAPNAGGFDAVYFALRINDPELDEVLGAAMKPRPGAAREKK